ncbi:MAG: N-acetyl-alpha-D-glucosaminyl L-malate synthase BshA [Planctomycetota bacterium]|nr:N-acetyl-alpha-D-glucosaminyl L-malate synthase BshA [Planctomycetota bacterium]
MKIAIACYPTYGGSGVIATELGLALAERGHEVHFLSYEPPYRLGQPAEFLPNVYFHEVHVSAYPLFRYPPYDLALASKMVEVVETHGVEILHAHYAVPHAVSAVLAREMLGNGVKVLTTLHGTDVTLVGQDKSYLPATRYGIRKSDAVTAVSNNLAAATRALCMACEIKVIYNFVDTERYAPRPCGETRAHFAGTDDKVLMHISNFRPVKRPGDVVRIFARVAREMPAQLWLVGEGPELVKTEALAKELGVADRVHALGQRSAIEQVLPCADLFLLPSEQESFGLAALEAMACGVPCLTSNVGGLPEVIEDGVSGLLGEPGDVDGMASRALALLTDPEAYRKMADQARLCAVERFDRSIWIGEYESAYRQLLQS